VTPHPHLVRCAPAPSWASSDTRVPNAPSCHSADTHHQWSCLTTRLMKSHRTHDPGSAHDLYLYRHCRYPADRIPLHTSLKSRQVTGRASTHCHMPYGSGPHLPVEIGSGIAMCPMAPELASWLRWALALPCGLWLCTSPPG
jgi:hypothetical protein